jgi:hypothetical protein
VVAFSHIFDEHCCSMISQRAMELGASTEQPMPEDKEMRDVARDPNAHDAKGITSIFEDLESAIGFRMQQQV